jgi:opacity protein-like surface antigen
MKQIIQISILSSALLSTQVLAINPIQGIYGGLMAEVSHGPSNAKLIFHRDGLIFNGTVGYSVLSGGAGGFLGYKYKHFRVEGELLYNRTSTGPLKVGTCTIQSTNIITPTGACPPGEYDHFKADALGYSGSSNATYGMINGFYDFFADNIDTYIAPYIGIGIGTARIKDSNNLVNTHTLNSVGKTVHANGSAYEGILGLSYYMDDFTSASVDYRYLSTKSLPSLGNKSYTLNAINFTINFAFDMGSIGS